MGVVLNSTIRRCPLGESHAQTINPAVCLVAVISRLAWWSAWQLRAAVKARDSRHRPRRLADIAQQFQAIDWRLSQGGGPNPDAGLRHTQRTLGPLVAGQSIEIAVTPSTLAFVLAGNLAASEIKRDVSANAEVDAIDDQLSPRRLRWAFFETPTRFRIEATAQTDRTKRVVSIFALSGSSWKLVASTTISHDLRFPGSLQLGGFRSRHHRHLDGLFEGRPSHGRRRRLGTKPEPALFGKAPSSAR
jgi:hypothetical protein